MNPILWQRYGPAFERAVVRAVAFELRVRSRCAATPKQKLDREKNAARRLALRSTPRLGSRAGSTTCNGTCGRGMPAR